MKKRSDLILDCENNLYGKLSDFKLIYNECSKLLYDYPECLVLSIASDLLSSIVEKGDVLLQISAGDVCIKDKYGNVLHEYGKAFV